MPLDHHHVTEPEFTQHSRLFSDLGNLLVNDAVGFCSSSIYFGNSLLQCVLHGKMQIPLTANSISISKEPWPGSHWGIHCLQSEHRTWNAGDVSFPCLDEKLSHLLAIQSSVVFHVASVLTRGPVKACTIRFIAQTAKRF